MVLGILAAQSVFAGDPDSEEGIVAEARALERDPVLRTAHVNPVVPGTFEEGLAPWVEALAASTQRFKDQGLTPKALVEVFDRRGPVPDDWRAEVLQNGAMIEGALAATHRAGARLPPGGRLEGIPESPVPGWREFHHLPWLGLLEARLASDRGDHGLALRRCADVLAWNRDLSWSALFTALPVRAMIERPVRACLDLSRRAPLAERRRFAEAVALIQAGWAPRSAVLRRERLFAQLLFASGFSDENRAALPPSLRPVMEMGPEMTRMGAVRSWLFGGMARRAMFQQITSLMAAVDGPLDVADARIVEFESTTPTSVRLAGVDSGSPPSPWLKMIRGLRQAEAWVVLLHAELKMELFQAARGAPPKTWRDVVPEGAPTDPRTGRALVLEVVSGRASVRAEADPSREVEALVFAQDPVRQ